jgi:hypothetical protein
MQCRRYTAGLGQCVTLLTIVGGLWCPVMVGSSPGMEAQCLCLIVAGSAPGDGAIRGGNKEELLQWLACHVCHLKCYCRGFILVSGFVSGQSSQSAKAAGRGGPLPCVIPDCLVVD